MGFFDGQWQDHPQMDRWKAILSPTAKEIEELQTPASPFNATGLGSFERAVKPFLEWKPPEKVLTRLQRQYEEDGPQAACHEWFKEWDKNPTRFSGWTIVPFGRGDFPVHSPTTDFPTPPASFWGRRLVHFERRRSRLEEFFLKYLLTFKEPAMAMSFFETKFGQSLLIEYVTALVDTAFAAQGSGTNWVTEGTYSEPSRRRDFWEKKLPNHNGSSFPYPPLPKVTDREILRELFVPYGVLRREERLKFGDGGLFPDNKALAYVGDGLIRFTLARLEKRMFPNIRSGGMTLLSAELETNVAMALYAVKYKLHTRLVLPPEHEALRNDPGTQADVFEAYVGAISTSLGVQPAIQFVEEFFGPRLHVWYHRLRKQRQRDEQLAKQELNPDPPTVSLPQKAVDSAHGSQGKSRSGKQIPVSRIPDNAKADIFAKDVIQESKQPKKPLDKTTNRAPSPSSRQTPASPRPILPDSTLGHPPEMAQLVGATTGSWIKSLDDIASTEIPHPASWDEQHLGRAGEAVSEVVSAGSSRDETIVEPKAVEDEVNVGHQGVPENAIDEQALLEDDPVSENARLQDEEDLENEQDLLEDDQAIEEDQALLEDDQVLEDEQARLEDEQELEDEQDLLADEQAMEDERALLEDAQALENVRELLENEQDADEEQALLEDEPALEPVQAVLEDGDALEDEQDLLEDEQSVQDEQALLEHEQALEDEQELLEEEEGLEDDQDVLEDKEAGEDEQALLEDERALEDEQSLLPEERGKPETVKRVAEDPETVAEERSDPPLRDITRRWGSVHTASDPLVEEGEGVESDEQKLMAKNRELPSSDHDERTRLGLTDDERRRTRLSPAPRRAYLTKMDYIQLTTLDEVLEHVNRGGEPVAERQAAVPQQRQRARRVRERQEGAALSQHQDLVSEARRELGAAKEEPARVDAPAEGSKSSKSSARQRRLAADDEEMRAFAEAIEGRMQDAPKLRLASSARFSIGTPDPEPPTEGARTAAAGGLRSGGLERPENMQSDRVGRLPGLHAFGRADGWDQKLRQKAEAGWELRMKLKVQASRVATALRERASQANRPPVRPRPKGQGARIGRNLLMAVKKV